MVDAETLEDRFHAVAGCLNAFHAQLVDLTVEALADPNTWESWQCGSIEKFVAWQVGGQIHLARKVVQIARRIDDLPQCVAAFREGSLSLDQMAPIAKRVPWWADEEICRQAQMMTVEQITRTASRYRWDLDIPKPDGTGDGLERPEPSDVDDTDTGTNDTGTNDTGGDLDESISGDSQTSKTQPVDTLSMWWDDERRLHLDGEFDAATGSIVENALTEARDSLFHEGRADVDWADAFAETCQRSLDTIESPARRSRYRVHIHRNSDGSTTSATGRVIDDAVAEYISCDALRSDVFEVDGVPISVGRTQHTVPERTRRTVIHRDGGCRVPGCGDTRWLDVHHIVHWVHGGPTDTDNLIALCKKHHRTHHQGRLGIIGNADDPGGVRFTNRHGQPIRGSGTRPVPPGQRSAIETPTTTYRPALRERLESRWQHFNPPVGFRPRWDHELQQPINPRQHAAPAIIESIDTPTL